MVRLGVYAEPLGVHTGLRPRSPLARLLRALRGLAGAFLEPALPVLPVADVFRLFRVWGRSVGHGDAPGTHPRAGPPSFIFR